MRVAARLESASKQYGLEILVGESTLAPVRDRFAARLIDLVSSLPPGAPVSITATETTVAITCGKAMPELPSLIDVDDATGCIEISGADALVGSVGELTPDLIDPR